MVESRNDRVENAWGLGWPRTRLPGGKQENFKIKAAKKNGELSYWKEGRRRSVGRDLETCFLCHRWFLLCFCRCSKFFPTWKLRVALSNVDWWQIDCDPYLSQVGGNAFATPRSSTGILLNCILFVIVFDSCCISIFIWAERSVNLNAEEMYNQFPKVKSGHKTGRIGAHENLDVINMTISF